MKKIILASLLAAASLGAHAQGYLGATVGSAHISLDCPANVACKDNSTSFKVYGGAEFTPIVSGEIGYIDFGSFKGDSDAQAYHRSAKAQALTISVAARAQIAPRFNAVGRLGLAVVTSTDDVNYLGVASNSDAQTTSPYVGFGLELAASKEFRGVVNLDLTRVEDRDGGKHTIRLLSVGGQFDF
jgi:OOP family OmpA-OmpF porin